MKTKTVLLSVAWLVGCAAAVWAQPEWREWRGPGRAGDGASLGRVSAWPSELELVWRVPVGIGHAAPVVADGRVCLHHRDDRKKEEIASCHDLATGEEIWSQSYAAPFNTALGGGHHEAGPKATPTLRDGRLFTFGISGILSVWDVTSGELAWRRDFGDEHKKPWPHWGVSASPLVEDGRVYVQAGRKEGAFYALDAVTGEEIWRVDRVRAAYGSPVVAELDGVRQLVALSEDGPLGISLEGQRLWRIDHEHDQNIPSPVVIGDYVLLSSKGRPTRALRPRQFGERWGVKVMWENKEIPLHMSSFVPVGERFCGFSHRKKGFAFCAEAATGEIVWRSPSRFAKHAIAVSIQDGLLFVTSDGRLRVLGDGDEFREVASYELTEQEVWSHPAILRGTLLVKSYDELLYWRLPVSGASELSIRP